MISAEAPVVFAKACEIFILELTMRAWNLTEDNKRRTLQVGAWEETTVVHPPCSALLLAYMKN